MRCTSFLVLSCILKCVGVVLATCTVNKYEEGYGDRVQCSNETLRTILNQNTTSVAALMIFKSELQHIPERAFSKYAGTLVSLNIQQCKIQDILQYAFKELSNLKKLSLPNNNLTRVREEWFTDLLTLEQLDLSFNSIEKIEPTVFGRIRTLRRLDLMGNRLTCLDTAALQPLGALEKLRFSGNPLNFQCRGKLTLWLRDHGVNYKTDLGEKESWLDSLLWLCAMEDSDVAGSEDLMKECVILNLFNQLRMGLTTAESYPLKVPQDCIYARNLLTTCVSGKHGVMQGDITNGKAITKLLLNLRGVKSAV